MPESTSRTATTGRPVSSTPTNPGSGQVLRLGLSHSTLRRKIRIEIKADINPFGDASGRCLLAGSNGGHDWSCGWHTVGLTVATVRSSATRHRDNHVADALYRNHGRLRPYPPPQRATEHLVPLEAFL